MTGCVFFVCHQVSSRLEQQAVGQEDMAKRMVAIPSIRGGEGTRGHTVATDNHMLREFIIVRVLPRVDGVVAK